MKKKKANNTARNESRWEARMRLLATGVLAILWTACMNDPTNNTTLQSYEQNVTFNGVVFGPKETINVEVLNQSTGAWETLTTTTSGATPLFVKGASGDNPDMYFWSVTTPVATNSQPATLCRWSAACAVSTDVFGVYSAQLRVRRGSNHLLTFESDWGSCVQTEVSLGRTLLQGAIACGSPKTPVVRLRDIYEWSTVPSHDASGSLGTGFHPDDGLHIASVTPTGQVRVTHTPRPEEWDSTSQPSGGPAGGFALDTAPLLLSGDDGLHLLARGADNNLYRATRIAGAWSAFDALTLDGSVLGRISATFTSSETGTLLHVVYKTVRDAVRYAQFSASSLLATHTWVNAMEGTIGSNGTNRLAVALRRSDRISMQRAAAATGWVLTSAGEMVEDVFDVSNIIHLGTGFHVLYARAGVVSGTTTHELRHIRIPESGLGISFRTVGNYEPSGSSHALTALASYRGRLIAAWDDAADGVRSARWDTADPSTPWILGPVIGKTPHEQRPALVSGNLRQPPLIGPDPNYANPNYGDDVFAASARSGRVVFTNFSRNMMRRDIERQFALYNRVDDTRVPVADPWLDDRPVLTEIGFNLWMLPHWFVNARTLYKKVAQGFCETGHWNFPPCYAAKLPVIVKPEPKLFIATGIHIPQNTSAIDVWQELGHYLTVPMGIDNSSPAPEAKHAKLTGIPLPALEQAHAIFKEGTSSCRAGPRCRGFTGFAGNYDAGGRAHSFIYTVYYYLDRPNEIRQFIEEDLAEGNDLLQRKYNWVRTNIFKGVEF